MRKSVYKKTFTILVIIFISSCNPTKGIKYNELLLDNNKVFVNDTISNDINILSLVKQNPNSKPIGLGIPLRLYIHNLSKNDTLKSFKKISVNEFLKDIGEKPVIIDSLKTERNQGLYELGLIYKQQFVNLPLSIEKLERLLTLNPLENQLLSIYYNLYQIYSTVKNKPKETFYKNKILTGYADTKFAQMIQFPDQKLTSEKSLSEIEKTYKEMYYLYKEGVFEEVVQKIDEMLPKIQNSILIPKFELLRAYSLGRYVDKETYGKAMEFVALRYGNSEEGKKAKKIVAQLRK